MGDTNSEYPTVLGSDAKFKGQLEFEKGVRLLGKFEGEITSGGQLLVADGAALTGDVKAGTIRVDGNVKGNLEASTKVQLTASAKVKGDVHAARLEVAEGAVLVGHCMVGVNGQDKPTAQVKSGGTQSAGTQLGAAPAGEPQSKPKGQVQAMAGAKR